MAMSNFLSRLKLKPGLSAKWSHDRKIAKNLALGYRYATEDDVEGSDLFAGELTLLIKEDIPVEVTPVEKTEENQNRPIATKKAATIKRPHGLVHKQGYKMHWCHADQVMAKIAKGYHIVAKNELVNGEDSIDVVSHNGHLLMAKGEI